MTIGAASATMRTVTSALRGRGLVEGWSGSREPGVILAEGPSLELSGRLRAAAAKGVRVLVGCAVGARVAEPWALLRDGAEDVVTIDQAPQIDHAIARLERWSEVDRVLESPAVRDAAIGDAPLWRQALREVVEIARFTTSPMLITGETGTGKEVVARLLHDLGPQAGTGEMVLVDCTAVVPALSGSEFFGHEKGAFTGAAGPRTGAFARANGGTLFLDEVGELPLGMQAELLRVVQEGAYKPVGGNDWQYTSFRLVAATNRDLHAAQQRGEFRSDLYFRLAGAHVHLPPLRDRPDDIVPLFRHFFAAARGGTAPTDLDPAVADLLVRRPYPGNVRDLRQLALRVATRHVGVGPVTPGDVPPGDRPVASPPASDPDPAAVEEWPDARTALEQAIRGALAAGLGLPELKVVVPEMATRIALDQAGGPTAAARLLGVSRRAVGYRTRARGEAAGSGHPADGNGAGGPPDAADEPDEVAAQDEGPVGG